MMNMRNIWKKMIKKNKKVKKIIKENIILLYF